MVCFHDKGSSKYWAILQYKLAVYNVVVSCMYSAVNIIYTCIF